MPVAAITGSASGIGAAIKSRFEQEGFDVIGVDLRNAEVEADLTKPDGRKAAADGILHRLARRRARGKVQVGPGLEGTK